jgi:hypothetical protein
MRNKRGIKPPRFLACQVVGLSGGQMLFDGVESSYPTSFMPKPICHTMPTTARVYIPPKSNVSMTEVAAKKVVNAIKTRMQ